MNAIEAEARLRQAVCGSWFPIDTLECMAALCTFGWEPRYVPVTKLESVEAPAKDTWWLKVKPQSPTGYDFRQCFIGWHKPATLPSEHRMRDVRAYADFHLGLIRTWRQARRLSGGETVRRAAIPYLAGVTNTKLAAALLAGGFCLDVMGVTRTDVAGKDQATYWFTLESEGWKVRWTKFLENWERFGEFEAKNPEDPMCYQRAYCENREHLIQLHKDSIPQILIPRGNRSILVTPGLLPRYKRALERMV